jgi:hypothetical protein
MARTTNQYFNVLGVKGEQRLVEDLIIEAIRINGMQVYYVPRTLVKEDAIFGEDTLSRFEKTFPIEMYFDNPGEGFQGDRFLISKFGMEMRDTASFVVSRRRFNEVVLYDNFNAMPQTDQSLPLAAWNAQHGAKTASTEVRPMNGDIIYMPLTNDLFQIMNVDHESVFYQIGYRYIWRIAVQKFDYSAETISTGIPGIDRVQEFFDNVDSVANDPSANNDVLIEEGKKIINTQEKNVFGDPV